METQESEGVVAEQAAEEEKARKAQNDVQEVRRKEGDDIDRRVTQERQAVADENSSNASEQKVFAGEASEEIGNRVASGPRTGWQESADSWSKRPEPAWSPESGQSPEPVPVQNETQNAGSHVSVKPVWFIGAMGDEVAAPLEPQRSQQQQQPVNPNMVRSVEYVDAAAQREGPQDGIDALRIREIKSRLQSAGIPFQVWLSQGFKGAHQECEGLLHIYMQWRG